MTLDSEGCSKKREAHQKDTQIAIATQKILSPKLISETLVASDGSLYLWDLEDGHCLDSPKQRLPISPTALVSLNERSLFQSSSFASTQVC